MECKHLVNVHVAYIPVVTEFDTGPLPSMLVAKTDTVMLLDMGQDDEDTLNS